MPSDTTTSPRPSHRSRSRPCCATASSTTSTSAWLPISLPLCTPSPVHSSSPCDRALNLAKAKALPTKCSPDCSRAQTSRRPRRPSSPSPCPPRVWPSTVTRPRLDSRARPLARVARIQARQQFRRNERHHEVERLLHGSRQLCAPTERQFRQYQVAYDGRADAQPAGPFSARRPAIRHAGFRRRYGLAVVGPSPAQRRAQKRRRGSSLTSPHRYRLSVLLLALESCSNWRASSAEGTAAGGGRRWGLVGGRRRGG